MKFMLATAAVAAICAGVPALAFAQDTNEVSENGVYGDLGWSHVMTHGADTDGIQGRVGARFYRFFGIEGEIGGGLSNGSNTVDFTSGTPPVTTPTSVGVKQTLAGAVYGVGFLPITHRFDLLARVGYGGSRYDVSPNGMTSYRVTENGIRYGVGGEYFLDGKNGIRVDYTREHMGNLDDTPGFFPARNANVWAVSYAHRF
ncbi:MAG TPA: outer membrane beta-barrel protein [Caulobacteraceae bacterium]